MNETDINQEEVQEVFDIRNNSKRAQTLMMVFGILTILLLIGLVASYLELQLLKKIQIGEYITSEEAQLNDSIQRVISIIQFGLFVTSVIVFLNWFRRAYGNLHRLRAPDLKNNESMAVWYWIIPIAVFFKPVQIMYEIWTKTQNKIRKFDPSYTFKNGGFLIGAWWFLFIVSNFVGRYVIQTAFKGDTIDEIMEASQASMIADMIHVPEALLVILIVYNISKMEDKLADEIRKSGGKIV